jgi:Zn-dependent M16 (insulinase) family peptidase
MSSVIKEQAAPFEHRRSRRIESLAVTVHEYRHRATGARHFHIESPDTNNSFLVALPTMPKDSTGVAHILEHTALCGSRRYPVRDPFFMMLRRSLNTFMNAFTSSDATAYPFASQNRKDFDNLLSVYLDAVFFPKLDPLDFAQEGHRVDLADAEDLSSRLVYKGVVYNEMKGAMSSPVARLWQTTQSALFPSTTYHYNSGGEPLDIPSLTHGALRAFHAEHYHPSNATFITYGSFPAEEHQARIHELALAHFDAIPARVHVEDERRLDSPRAVTGCYPVDSAEDTERATYVVVAWLLGHSFDLDALLEMHLLNGLLLDNSASPLRHALETTDLGRAPAPTCGLDDSTREGVLVCGLEGCAPDAAEAVERLILGTLEQVVQEGFAPEEVEAVLHQMELAQRSVGGGDWPYGLQLAQRILPAVLHGGDPIAVLDLDPALAALRARCAEPGWIQGLIQRRLIDNPHRVRVTLDPDIGLREREARIEQERLNAMAQQLDAAERAAIRARAEALDARQRSHDDPEILPRVTLADVPPDIRWRPGRVEQAAGQTVHAYAVGNNGLVNQQIVAALPAMDRAELEILPLLWSFITEVGVGGRDYLSQQRLQALTGRIQGSVTVRAMHEDPSMLRGWFVLGGKGLARNHARLTTLLADTLLAARFDETRRLRELVAQTRADAEASVTDHGHRLAMMAAAAGIAPASWLEDLWDGPASVARLAALDDALDDSAALDALAARLAALHARIAAASRHLVLVADEPVLAGALADIAAVWAERPSTAPVTPFTGLIEAVPVRQVFATNTQVNFCAEAWPAVPAAHEDAAALYVLAGLLHNGYLHRAVREQGGAYGSGARFDGDSASFRFFSYRDPRLEETLADFSRSIDWALSDGNVTPRALEESILGVIRSMDQPSSPAGEALQEHFLNLHGRTPELRRELRRRVLAVTIADVRRVAGRHFAADQVRTAVVTAPATAAGLEAEGYVRLDI